MSDVKDDKKIKDNKIDEPIVNEDSADKVDPTVDSDGKAASHEDGAGDTFGRDSISNKYDELMQNLKETEKKRDEYLSVAKRTQADFDNFRRRNKTSVSSAHKDGIIEAISTLLPVLDNLERAIDSAIQSNTDESFVKGVKMVQKQFVDCLENLGISEIEALNKPFDPEIHEAVMMVDAEEGQEENTVVKVLLKGYRMDDKVLRCSVVHVAH